MSSAAPSAPLPLCLVLKDPERSSRMELFLSADGHKVIPFCSVKELWQNFARWRPRYIITNREFADDFSALDLCRGVRREFPLPYCYIHILSGKSQLTEIDEALEAGASDYSIKPISPSQLRARVRVGLRWLAYIDSLTAPRA